MSAAAEELFLITYQQNGLLRRDSWFHQLEAARHHFAYLRNLFPDAGVQLHVIPVAVPALAEAAPADGPWHFLEF